MNSVLDPRAAELLKLLVERYIHDGQPVGSRTLSRAAQLNLSPATIRNVMADLDDLGFVASPHTSAGRIPTARGYRYFVDALLAPEPLTSLDQQRIARELGPVPVSDLVQTASSLLSSLSHMAGVVTVPRRNLAILRRIEFLPLSGNRVLAILVVNGHEVQNRVIHTERPYAADELERYAQLINENFAGRELASLRQTLMQEAADAQNRLNLVLKEAAAMAEAALTPTHLPEKSYIVSGGTNLMGFAELSDVSRLRGLFDALDRKRELLELFDQCLNADGVQIFIGGESGYTVLDEVSVVTAPYTVDGQVAGVLGVIGPTRMAYSRIIPLVSETARLLSASFKAD